MAIRVENFFAGFSADAREEQRLSLFENSSPKIERIVSRSHSSPPGFWYDPSEDEWVMVLRGQATLEFADGEMIQLKEGDYLIIPSHVKHRVDQTDPETIWLAVHVKK